MKKKLEKWLLLTAMLLWVSACSQLSIDDSQSAKNKGDIAPKAAVLTPIVSATASTVNGVNTAAMSCDGNTVTRWESVQGADPQWISWDLGSSKALSQIIIDWEGASASNYTIQGSVDSTTWTTLATVVNSIGLVNHLMITNNLSGTYRYVRMVGTTRTTIYGYSIYEVSIYTGAPASSVSSASSTPAVSSSVSSVSSTGQTLLTINAAVASTVTGANTAALSFDKNTGTRWESATADPQWIYWDLGSAKQLSSIMIDWEVASASNYTIQGSADAATWTILATVMNASKLNHTQVITALSGTYRYVKMNGTTRTSPYGYSIWEVSIYSGTPASSAASSTPVVSSSSVVSSVSSSPSSITGYITSINAAVASTVNGTETAALSCDRDTGTRWESVQGVDPQWIYWDLGSSKALTGIIIDWEVASAANYTIQGSVDSVTWTTLATVINSKAVEHLQLTNTLSGTYRYVKMNGTSRTTVWGYSIWEVSIYTSTPSSSSVASTPASSSSSVSSTASSYATSSTSYSTGGTGTYPIIIQNNTHGKYKDSEIYIEIIGMYQNQWCHALPDGTFLPFNAADADAPGHLTKNGRNFPNYGFNLTQFSNFYCPPSVGGGRIYISVGSPMYMTGSAGGISLPDPENVNEPNNDVYYDWVEFTYIYGQLAWGGNTTQVDSFGISMTMRLKQDSSGYDSTIGITNSRDSIYAIFSNTVDPAFLPLTSQYRIVAPYHCANFKSGSQTNYLDGIINATWNYYTTHQLNFTNTQDNQYYIGSVVNNVFQISQNGKGPYSYQKPTSMDVWTGGGAFANDPSGVIGSMLDAVFNRGVATNSSVWLNSAAQYPTGVPKNDYSMVMHKISLMDRAYGFGYDDKFDFSSVRILGNSQPPTSLTIGVYW